LAKQNRAESVDLSMFIPKIVYLISRAAAFQGFNKNDVLWTPMIQLPVIEVESPVDAAFSPSTISLLRFAEPFIPRQPAELPGAIKPLYFQPVIFRLSHLIF